jgi:hypothetical protein
MTEINVPRMAREDPNGLMIELDKRTVPQLRQYMLANGIPTHGRELKRALIETIIDHYNDEEWPC